MNKQVQNPEPSTGNRIDERAERINTAPISSHAARRPPVMTWSWMGSSALIGQPLVAGYWGCSRFLSGRGRSRPTVGWARPETAQRI